MEYKDNDECNTERSKAVCPPDEKDDSCEEAFNDAVQKLLNVQESESIDYFCHLQRMIKNKKLKIDSSAFVSSGVVETLVNILFEDTPGIHSKALSLLCTLSNYNEVAQFLNQEEIIKYLINFALDFNNSMKDICYDFYILKKIVPFMTDEDVNSFPVEEFSGMELKTAPITFFTELLVHHPDSILFDRIILYFNRFTPFISRTVHLAETFLKAVIPKHPEKIYTLVDCNEGIMRKIFLLNLIYNIAGNDYEGSSDLFCIFHEPLIKQCNDRPQIFEILNETKQFEIACDIFYDKESEEEHKINSLRFIEDWCINDCLHDLAMQNLNDNMFLSLIDYIDDSCNGIKSSLLGIFSYILKCHEFIYAETIVDRGILNVIDDFIGTDTIKALTCLDIIFKHYIEHKREKEIIKLINNTEIIDNLDSAVENSINEEEEKPIIEFLQKYQEINDPLPSSESASNSSPSLNVCHLPCVSYVGD